MQFSNSFADFSNNISKLINQKNFKKAHSMLEQVLIKQGSNALLWHLKSVVSLSEGNFFNAEKEIMKALALKPNLTPALSNLSKLKKQQHLFKEAIELIAKAISYEPNNLNFKIELVVCYNLDKQPKNALSSCKQLLAQFPNNIQALICATQSQLQLENYTEVVTLSDKILQLDSRNLSAINNKAIALKELCLWHDAIELLDYGLSLSKQHPVLLKNKASCYVLTGDHKGAASIYETLTEQAPEDLDSHHWLNMIYWEQKDSRFLKSYDFAIKRVTQNPNLYIEKSKKQILAKEFSSAEESLQFALRIAPSSSYALHQLGILKRESKQFDRSLELLSKASEIAPRNFEIKEEFSKSLIATGQSKAALRHIDELLSVNEFQQGWLALKTIALKQLKSDEYYYLINYERDLFESFINVPKGFNTLNEFNLELGKILRKYHYSKQHPLNQSLMGGTQTAEKLFDYHLPIIETLRVSLREQTLAHLSKLPKDDNHPMLKRNTGDFIETDSWSVLLKSNGFHNNHHHPAGWLSSPYYINIPKVVDNENNKQGWIKFGQPGFAMSESIEPDLYAKPEEGKLIQFPSYYWHGTEPFTDVTERMCVAYDVVPL